jgi:hypothetical protein
MFVLIYQDAYVNFVLHCSEIRTRSPPVQAQVIVKRGTCSTPIEVNNLVTEGRQWSLSPALDTGT